MSKYFVVIHNPRGAYIGTLELAAANDKEANEIYTLLKDIWPERAQDVDDKARDQRSDLGRKKRKGLLAFSPSLESIS